MKVQVVGALAVVALALASACGSESDPTPSDTATSSPAASPKSAKEDPADSPVMVAVRIKDGKAVPQGKRVEIRVGQPVNVSVASDADDEIHVHSDPEHSINVKAGQRTSKTFTIDRPGQVAVESHHLGVTLVQLVVRP